MPLKLRFTLLCLLAFLGSAAHAATLNVGVGQPYVTIQSAINAANFGDTVLVAPGIYNENIDFRGKAITVTSSAGPATTIIDGGAKYGVATVTFQSGELRTSVISNFTIRNGGDLRNAYAAGGGVYVTLAAPTIQGNVITGNTCSNINARSAAALITGNDISSPLPATGGYPCYVGGILIDSNFRLGSYSHTDVIGNTIENNSGTYGGGIEMSFATGSIIQSNIIRNNQAVDGGGIYIDTTDTFSVVQNLIYGNTTIGNPGQPSGISIVAPGPTVGPVSELIANNTITDSLAIDGSLAQFLIINNVLAGASATTPVLQCPAKVSLAITPASFDHNLIYNATGPAYSPACAVTPGTYGNISADPLFLAPATGNYQLASNSPAIDAGNNSSPFLPATDLAGSPRVTDNTRLGFPVIDMGAYETTGTLDRGPTTVSLTPSEYFASSNPTPAPPPLTFTVALASAAGPPFGSVAIYEDTTLLGIVKITSATPVTFTPTNITPGTHSFTAVFPASLSGGVNAPPAYLTPAVSPRFYLLVPQTITGLQLASSLNPSPYNTAVTFTITASTASGSYPSPITLTDTTTNTLLATLTPNASGLATASANLLPGTHTITAAFAGTANQSPASATLAQVVGPDPSLSALTVASSLSGAPPYNLQVTVSGGNPLPTPPSGTVTFFNGSNELAMVTLGNGSANLVVPTAPIGTGTFTCLYSGDQNYSAGNCNSVPYTYTPATNQPQTITFPPPASPAYDATSVSLLATSSSGLPIAYQVLSGPAAVTQSATGSTLTYTGLGTVTIQATQAGNTTYNPAPPVTATVTTQLLTQTLTTRTGPIPTVILFTASGTLANINITTQGAPSLDFAPAGTLPVPTTACAIGATYTAGQTCVAYFTFAPTHPGPRFGGITLTDAQGNLLANSYLLGSGTGPQLFYLPATQSTIGSGFGYLSGAAVDGFGNLFLSDKTSGISEITLATGATRNLNPLPGAADVIVDGSGNVFAIDNTRVVEFPAVNGVVPPNPTPVVLATGFIELDGVKVDSNGNIFVADGGNATHPGSVTELLAVNGVIPPNPATFNIRFSPRLSILTGVAVDVQGDVFASDQQNHGVFEALAVNGVVPANPTILNIGSGFIVPTNVAFDGIGDLFVPDAGTHSVREIVAVNGIIPPNPTIVDLGSGLVSPQGLVVDPSGNVFIADSSIAQATELNYGVPPTLTFTPTQINTTSPDSPKSFTITNAGNADLVFPAPATGTNPTITPGFTFDPTSTCPSLSPGSTPFALHSAQSCTTAVDFLPTTVGTVNGTIVRTDNNLDLPGSTQTVKLIGTGLGIPPTITFAVPNHTLGDPPFAVLATSNSPAPLTYSVVSGPATIAAATVTGATVTLTGAGTVTLQAAQPATATYAAGTALATFQVFKQAQTITFAAPATPIPFSAAPFPLQATATSGLPVVFSIVSGPGRISGSTLTLAGGGTIVVAADQPGNPNYAPAPRVTHTITVQFGVPTVTLSAAPSPVFLFNPVTLVATVSSPAGTPTGTVTFLDLSGPAGPTPVGIAPISGGQATITTTALAVGSHTLTAVYSGDLNYTTLTSPAVIVLVEDFSLVITNPTVTIAHGGTAAYNLVVTAVGGPTLVGTVTLASSGQPLYSTYAFAPAIIGAGSGTTTGTLTIHTPDFPSGPFEARLEIGSAVTFASLLALILPNRRRRRSLLGVTLLLLAALGSTALLSGCGSGWKTQRWSVTVTATSGALTRTATATLISQP